MGRLLGRFRALPREERRLLVEAVYAVAVARLSLRVVPFSVLMRLRGLRLGGLRLNDGTATTDGNPDQARRIGRAIRRAVRHAPFQALCLPRALAASQMLRRRGLPAEVVFGVTRDCGGALSAHAWCLSGDFPVTGILAAGQYSRIARYHV